MVEFLHSGGRLAKPISCTNDVYDVMLQCWTERSVGLAFFSVSLFGCLSVCSVCLFLCSSAQTQQLHQ